MNKQVPETLLQKIREDKKKDIQEDAFNNFKKNINTPDYPRQILNHSPSLPYPPPPPLINKYAPQYATYVNAKPRAQPSARIGLGGAY
jgi:hypothetical protein